MGERGRKRSAEDWLLEYVCPLDTRHAPDVKHVRRLLAAVRREEREAARDRADEAMDGAGLSNADREHVLAAILGGAGRGGKRG